jgi:hypothetical protein
MWLIERHCKRADHTTSDIRRLNKVAKEQERSADRYLTDTQVAVKFGTIKVEFLERGSDFAARCSGARSGTLLDNERGRSMPPMFPLSIEPRERPHRSRPVCAQTVFKPVVQCVLAIGRGKLPDCNAKLLSRVVKCDDVVSE